ncbi:hypothetical protein ACFLZB_04545 [Nanoarchaeota archaeon]
MIRTLPKCIYLQQDFIKENFLIRKRWIEDTIKISAKQRKTITS